MSSNQLLTDDEEALVERYFIAICRYGFPISKCKYKAKRLIREIVKANGKHRRIGTNGPGEKWFEDFFKRHPDIEEKAESKPGKSDLTHAATIAVDHLLSLLGTSKTSPKRRRKEHEHDLTTPRFSGSFEEEDATDALDHDGMTSGCLDFVLPTYVLTACQDLPTGQSLQLQGMTSKQCGSEATAGAERMTITAKREEASVTFKLDTMGGIFKLSENWRCEVFSVTAPDDEAIGSYDNQSTLLDKISSGVLQAMNDELGAKDLSSDDDLGSTRGKYLLPSYLPDTLNTAGLSTMQGMEGAMTLESANLDTCMADDELQTDLNSYEEGEIPSPEDVESADHGVSSHMAADGIDLDSYEEGEVYNVDIVKEETRSKVKCRDRSQDVIVKIEVPTTLKPDNENYEESDSKGTQKELRCETCDKTFPYLSGLIRHSQMHYSSSNKPRNRKRKTKDELHPRNRKAEKPRTMEKKSYCCEVCGDVYNARLKFRVHLRKHARQMEKHIPKEKRHVCTTCGKKFAQTSALRSHMLVHTGERKYKCPFCGKMFKTKSPLDLHVRIHTGERPFVCTICGMAFAQSGTLSVHIIRIHKKERAHGCDICDKRFTTEFELKTHKQTHTGERPYICPKCGSAFSVKSYLKQHELVVHSGKIQYTCDFCGRGFIQQTQFKNHVRTHTGEKPYSCSYCRKSFNTNSHLKRHVRIHTGEKPYQCQQCGERFVQNECLKKHVSKHHQHSTIPQETNVFEEHIEAVTHL